MKRDISNQRFSRWTVVRFVGRIKQNSVWACRCDCGNVSEVSLANLTTGASQSCGCLRKEKKTTHGLYKSRTYSIWQNMHRRCADLNEVNYGAKGIKVCDRWKSFENFLADMGPVQAGHSIDRINNNLGYEASNCRWASSREQTRNTSRTRLISHNGVTLCLKDWAARVGISQQALSKRLRNQSVSASLETVNTIKEARCA